MTHVLSAISAIALVAIEYVGLKPAAIDNVSGSGKTWAGAGDVQHVTQAQAEKLLAHPDQWRLADQQAEQKPAAAPKPKAKAKAEAEAKADDSAPSVIIPAPDDMTDPSLVATVLE